MTKMKERMAAQEVSREELAAKTKISYGGIAKMDTGMREPKVRNAIKIAKALKTTAEKLWGTIKKGES